MSFPRVGMSVAELAVYFQLLDPDYERARTLIIQTGDAAGVLQAYEAGLISLLAADHLLGKMNSQVQRSLRSGQLSTEQRRSIASQLVYHGGAIDETIDYVLGENNETEAEFLFVGYVEPLISKILYENPSRLPELARLLAPLEREAQKAGEHAEKAAQELAFLRSALHPEDPTSPLSPRLLPFIMPEQLRFRRVHAARDITLVPDIELALNGPIDSNHYFTLCTLLGTLLSHTPDPVGLKLLQREFKAPRFGEEGKSAVVIAAVSSGHPAFAPFFRRRLSVFSPILNYALDYFKKRNDQSAFKRIARLVKWPSNDKVLILGALVDLDEQRALPKIWKFARSWWLLPLREEIEARHYALDVLSNHPRENTARDLEKWATRRSARRYRLTLIDALTKIGSPGSFEVVLRLVNSLLDRPFYDRTGFGHGHAEALRYFEAIGREYEPAVLAWVARLADMEAAREVEAGNMLLFKRRYADRVTFPKDQHRPRRWLYRMLRSLI